MTPQDDLATLLSYLGKQRCSQEHHDALGAARRLEAHIAALTQERDEARKGQLFANDDLMRIERDLERCRERHTEQRERAEAAEAALAEANGAMHFCETVEEGWRPCPASLCEADKLHDALAETKQERDQARAVLRRSPIEMESALADCQEKWLSWQQQCIAAEEQLADTRRALEGIRSLANAAKGIEVLPSPVEWERLREPLWDAIQDAAAAYDRALAASEPTGPTTLTGVDSLKTTVTIGRAATCPECGKALLVDEPEQT